MNEQDEHQARPNPFKAIGFMIAMFPLRLVQFVLLVVGATLGLATTIIWIGIPILMLTTAGARYFGDLERRWLPTMLAAQIPQAQHPPREGNLLRRWRTQLTEPRTWRDTGYLLLAFPLAVFEFVLAIPSIILVPMAIWVVPWVGWLHARLAGALLGPPRAQRAERKAQQLQASRARGVDAAEAERRRIERDLHDGAQQRLVSLAMGLGRAKSKLDSDLDAARELLDEAHADAKQAVSELRDLARGIYPAVLADRGLDAALSAQAAKSPIPVHMDVDIDPRPPAAVETTAYFIAGEALANIAKHSGATEGHLRAWRTDDTVTIEISDNGTGGAEIRPSGGLAGLADRAATIDGVVTVVSPLGSGTVIRADLPCSW